MNRIRITKQQRTINNKKRTRKNKGQATNNKPNKKAERKEKKVAKYNRVCTERYIFAQLRQSRSRTISCLAISQEYGQPVTKHFFIKQRDKDKKITLQKEPKIEKKKKRKRKKECGLLSPSFYLAKPSQSELALFRMVDDGLSFLYSRCVVIGHAQRRVGRTERTADAGAPSQKRKKQKQNNNNNNSKSY